MGEARAAPEGEVAAAAPPAAGDAEGAAAATAAAVELVAAATRAHALPDGRTLSYVDCGDASSSDVILFLHPVQGNRQMALVFHSEALRLGLRVIAPDRPGYGQSSPHPGRSVATFVADLAHLLGALGVARAGVLGSSAGSMYALALTRDPATRPLVAGRVTLLPPWVPPGSRLPAGGPRPLGLRVLGVIPAVATGLFVALSNRYVMWKLSGQGTKVSDVMTRARPHEVEAFASDPANDVFYKAMIAEWARPGAAAAVADEMLLCAEAGPARALGFDYASGVQAPVRVFAAEHDALVPIAAVRAWAAAANGASGVPVGESAGDSSSGGGGGGGGAAQGPQALQRVELVEVVDASHDGVVHTHKGQALGALAADLRGGAAAARPGPG